MFSNVQLLTVGIAAVLETVLLVAMLERRNRRHTTFWIVLLLLGTWMWHCSTFVYALFTSPQGFWAGEFRCLAMVGMAAGLLLMPSALLHGTGRLWKSGVAMNPPWRPVYALCYLPMLMIIPLAWEVHRQPNLGFLAQLGDYVKPYVAWIVWVNFLGAATCWRFSFQIAAPGARAFLRWFTGILVLITVGTVWLAIVMPQAGPEFGDWSTLAVTLLPALPALLFAYFVIRFQFLSVMLERALVYGAIAACLMLFHQVALQDLTSSLSKKYHVDFGILEVAAGVLLIVLYQPLRQRAAEALRYLMGSRVSAVRDQTRELAVQMSERAGQSPEELLNWFTTAVQTAMHVDWTAAWMFASTTLGDSTNRNSTATLPVAWAKAGSTNRLSVETAFDLHRVLAAARFTLCAEYEAPTDQAAVAMSQADASLAVRIDHPSVAGLLLLGRAPWNRQPGEEELNSLVLLVEQLGSTLHNSQLQRERLSIERRALQSEKLATLGLMAGSIAHEIKNPLSSIKTLATVASEQLGDASPLAEDLRLIVGEVDRLTATTSQLLEFARPQASGTTGNGAARNSACVRTHVERLLRMMRHLASQKRVQLEARWSTQLAPVAATDAALQEIFFNLLTNALDATDSGGRISVTGDAIDGLVLVTIADTGRGMSPELQARAFEPFVTSKETGTGLGLHIVGQRVRELGGEIHCQSVPDQGTEFSLRLPIRKSE